MSDESLRRPRRIIAPVQPTALPEQQPVQTVAGERFARTLASRRLDGVRAMQSPASPASPAAPEKAAQRAPDVPSPATQAPRSSGGPSPQRLVPAVVYGFAQGATVLPSDDPAAVSGFAGGSSSGQHDDPAQQDWSEALAQRIGKLCRSADPSFRNWAVSLPIDSAALPETRLRLVLWPHRLTLHFYTDSGVSLRLIQAQRPHLLALLERALPQVREIDLEVS